MDAIDTHDDDGADASDCDGPRDHVGEGWITLTYTDGGAWVVTRIDDDGDPGVLDRLLEYHR